MVLGTLEILQNKYLLMNNYDCGLKILLLPACSGEIFKDNFLTYPLPTSWVLNFSDFQLNPFKSMHPPH